MRKAFITASCVVLIALTSWGWGGVVLWVQWVVSAIGLLAFAIALLPDFRSGELNDRFLPRALGLSLGLGLLVTAALIWSDLSLLLTQRDGFRQLFPDAEPAPGAPAPTGPYALEPTIELLEVEHPLVEWLVRVPRSGDPPARGAARLVLVYRHPERGTACYHLATDDLLFALKVAQDGLDPTQAALEAGLDPEAARDAMRQACALGVVYSVVP